MSDQPIGITFSETMSGGFALDTTDPQAGAEIGQSKHLMLSMYGTIEIRDLDQFIADRDHTGAISGHIDFEPLGNNIPAKHGTFNLFIPTHNPQLKLMVYELALEHEGQDYYFAGKKEVHDDPGFDLWRDTTTLYVQLHQGTDKSGPVVGAGILNLGVSEFVQMTTTMRATAPSIQAQTQALFKFGKFFLGELWDSYGPKAN